MDGLQPCLTIHSSPGRACFFRNLQPIQSDRFVSVIIVISLENDKRRYFMECKLP